jgi:AhpD family alkylhydroperoxidase
MAKAPEKCATTVPICKENAMTRIAGLAEHGVPPEIQAVYDRVKMKFGKLLEPLTVAANHSEIFKAYTSYEGWFATASRVDPKLKELATLKVAAVIGCPFCIDLGSAKAKAAGITEAQMRALPIYRESATFSKAEKLILEYAFAMTLNPVEVTDSLFTRLEGLFDPIQILEITATIAWENYRSRFNHALGMQSHGFSDQPYCVVPECHSGAVAEDLPRS